MAILTLTIPGVGDYDYELLLQVFQDNDKTYAQSNHLIF